MIPFGNGSNGKSTVLGAVPKRSGVTLAPLRLAPSYLMAGWQQRWRGA